jgi:hypothetical protein
MKFMMMHKNDPKTEAGEMPPMELVHEMGQFIGGYAQQGKLLDGAGLGASKTRTRLTFRNGEASVLNGPYAGQHELPASTLLLKVATRDEAIAWAKRYGTILGDGEIELGKVNELWDIGIMPPPPNPPLQILLIDKADAATEATGRTAEKTAAIAALKDEMTQAGVLVRTQNVLQVIDGPFSESKELIGGFAVMDLSGMDEILEICKRYAEILGGTLEVDVRLVE